MYNLKITHKTSSNEHDQVNDLFVKLPNVGKQKVS